MYVDLMYSLVINFGTSQETVDCLTILLLTDIADMVKFLSNLHLSNALIIMPLSVFFVSRCLFSFDDWLYI